MWFRGAAIRPVPKHARLGVNILEKIERELVDDTDRSRRELDEAFARFERTQPHLADHVGQVLARPLDETALALGYFLSIAIWLAFDRTFGQRLREVSQDAVRATETALALEEELRAAQEHEPLDLDDVVTLEQPGVLAFVHQHVDAALDIRARADRYGTEQDVDVDDVHVVYKMLLVVTLALSHAVVPLGEVSDGRELLA